MTSSSDPSGPRRGRLLPDDAFDAGAVPTHAPNKAQVVQRIEKASLRTRERLGEPKVFRYGRSEIETVSLYPAAAPGSPLHVHVHGGAWRQRKSETVLYPAEAFTAAGIGYATLDFTSADESAGDLRPMLAQVCNGLGWIAHHAAELGAEPQRLFVSGFSSGAHLTSAALISDWRPHGFDSVPYRAALFFGGVYDLEPVRLCGAYDYIHITEESEDRMSALRHADAMPLPVIVAEGGFEAPEFQRQARAMVAALQAAGRPVQHLRCDGYNHYEMMESFGHPYSPLCRAAIAQALRPT